MGGVKLAGASSGGKDRIIITASVGAIFLAAGILITVGKILNKAEYRDIEIMRLNSAFASLSTDLRDVRDYVDRQIATRTSSNESAKDLIYVRERLDTMEKRIARLERKHEAPQGGVSVGQD